MEKNTDCFLFPHSNGTGRTGTYILIDMVLNRMAKGESHICTHTHTVIDYKSLPKHFGMELNGIF